MKSLITFKWIFFLIFSAELSGQTLKPVAGPSTGYRKVYLDENAMPTDSINSFYWGYEYYDEGKRTFETFVREKNLKKYKITFEGDASSKGKPLPLNGTLKWLEVTDKGDIHHVLNTYANGYPQLYRLYMSECDNHVIIIDFNKKFNNTEGTFFIEDHCSALVLIECNEVKTVYRWYRKKGNKWKPYTIKKRELQSI